MNSAETDAYNILDKSKDTFVFEENVNYLTLIYMLISLFREEGAVKFFSQSSNFKTIRYKV